jgi:drug/metabolite transporter (DMT)-like permease
MANMNIGDRNTYERSTLSDTSGIRRGSERGSIIYTLIALPFAGLLCWVALSTIEGWWQWLVLGVIILTVYAFMRAVGPRRMGAGQASNPDQLSS